MELDHIQLAMPSGADASMRFFYAGMLGMREEEKPDALCERGGVWFRKGGVALHLGVEDDFVPRQKAHPAFLVPDIEALAARLQAEGYTVDWDIALADRIRFYTSDPCGNRLEFMREGDGFSQK
jgi:catechol 2,3-dioxygenase-like lactoylglutathione lyase family enzyme